VVASIWHQVSTPPYTNSISWIGCGSGFTCYVVGQPWTSSDLEVVAVTHDDGATWSALTGPAGFLYRGADSSSFWLWRDTAPANRYGARYSGIRAPCRFNNRRPTQGLPDWPEGGPAGPRNVSSTQCLLGLHSAGLWGFSLFWWSCSSAQHVRRRSSRFFHTYLARRTAPMPRLRCPLASMTS